MGSVIRARRVWPEPSGGGEDPPRRRRGYGTRRGRAPRAVSAPAAAVAGTRLGLPRRAAHARHRRRTPPPPGSLTRALNSARSSTSRPWLGRDAPDAVDQCVTQLLIERGLGCDSKASGQPEDPVLCIGLVQLCPGESRALAKYLITWASTIWTAFLGPPYVPAANDAQVAQVEPIHARARSFRPRR